MKQQSVTKKVKINELNQSIEDIREDDSLDDTRKETLIRKVRQEKSELEAERNKIVEPFEKDETRQKRVEGLEAIKDKALVMAREGADDMEVRDFVTEGKKRLAFELPDQEAFDKAVTATLRYKNKKKS